MGIWLIAFLVLIYLLICLALIFVILIQSGKGGGLSSLGQGAPGMGDVLGSTSAERTLTKVTTIMATSFFVMAILISFAGARRDPNRQAAELYSGSAPTTAPPVAPEDSPAATGDQAPAESSTDPAGSLPPVPPSAGIEDFLTEPQPPAEQAPPPVEQAPPPAEQAPAEQAPAPVEQAPAPEAAPAAPPAEQAPAPQAAVPPEAAPAPQTAPPAVAPPTLEGANPAPAQPAPAEPAPAQPVTAAPAPAAAAPPPAPQALPDGLVFEILGINPRPLAPPNPSAAAAPAAQPEAANP